MTSSFLFSDLNKIKFMTPPIRTKQPAMKNNPVGKDAKNGLPTRYDRIKFPVGVEMNIVKKPKNNQSMLMNRDFSFMDKNMVMPAKTIKAKTKRIKTRSHQYVSGNSKPYFLPKKISNRSIPNAQLE